MALAQVFDDRRLAARDLGDRLGRLHTSDERGDVHHIDPDCAQSLREGPRLLATVLG
ncbi:MAG TPA: hypothetical protein VFA34_04840 [Actinomycetota bacterium]|nr:hypothetical protein [Actinomycetota bacterium]